MNFPNNFNVLERFASFPKGFCFSTTMGAFCRDSYHISIRSYGAEISTFNVIPGRWSKDLVLNFNPHPEYSCMDCLDAVLLEIKNYGITI